MNKNKYHTSGIHQQNRNGDNIVIIMPAENLKKKIIDAIIESETIDIKIKLKVIKIINNIQK